MLFVFGSGGEEAATEAVFVIVPLVGDLTTIVIVAEAPLARLPRLQVTVAFDSFALQLPCAVVADANPAFFGS